MVCIKTSWYPTLLTHWLLFCSFPLTVHRAHSFRLPLKLFFTVFTFHSPSLLDKSSENSCLATVHDTQMITIVVANSRFCLEKSWGECLKCCLKYILDLSATPSAPYGITMLSCDGSSMTLAWKSPKHCGGSKVNAYYIDKRDADTLVWKEVNLAAVTERTCTVGLLLTWGSP